MLPASQQSWRGADEATGTTLGLVGDPDRPVAVGDALHVLAIPLRCLGVEPAIFGRLPGSWFLPVAGWRGVGGEIVLPYTEPAARASSVDVHNCRLQLSALRAGQGESRI